MLIKEIYSDESPLKGKIIFQQNQIPPLNSGRGSITVHQTVSSSNGDVPKTTYESLNQFAVNGPRFMLPVGAITSVFPPENAQGDYARVLPHVCFNRATLPWERTAATSSPAQGLLEAADQAPWLGILSVFDTDVAVKVSQIEISGLVKSPLTSDNDADTLPEHYFHPEFTPDPTTEKYTDKCLVVDIPVALFNKIAPCEEDMPWLAHVREIQPSNTQSARYLEWLKAISDQQTLPKISTVIGNRMPRAGAKSTGYLVSFENWDSYLPGEDCLPNGTRESKLPAGTTHVRLVLFKQWDFYAIDRYAKGRNQSFFGYLLHLNDKGNKNHNNNLLQLQPDYEPGDAGNAINNAFNMGYAPLNHHTRQGANTVSWYHGPFVPYDVKESKIDLPVNGPDTCTAYNPDTGMFDVSYAAAWQLGQLLALQNGNFAQSLYNWKWDNTRDAIAKFEQEIISKTLKEIVDEQAGPHSQEQLSEATGLNAQVDLLNLMNAGLSKILSQFIANKDNYSDEN